jgi:choline dehydrogenase-like flavoprotein
LCEIVRVDSASISSDEDLGAEIAVVGAGPAGIVIALELADAGHRVLLMESGSSTRRSAVQELGELHGEDPTHVSMSLATSRQIGGASNLWGGRCVPFDHVDFEHRDLVTARWPVSYEEISSYFQRVCDWCVCGEAVFNARAVSTLAQRSLVPGFSDGRVSASTLERWSLPTNFWREYHDELIRHPRITLMTNLTCTEIMTESSGRHVSHLRASTLDGKTFKVLASHYVLACGGLEVTRLLLASNRDEGGLGNASGHVGRWYMAHVESRIARVHFATDASETIYGHEQDPAGVYVRRRMTFSEEFLIDHDLSNTALWLANPDVADSTHGSGILSFVYLMLVSPLGRYFVAEGIRQAHIHSDANISVRRHLGNVIRELPAALAFAMTFGYRRFIRRGRKVPGFFVRSAANVYPLVYHGEHLPNRASHVELAAVSDALGVPRLRTHLTFGDQDVVSVLRAHEYLDEYLRELGLGHLEYIYEDSAAAVREQLFGGYHQAGTTRMSDSPEDGVVDRDLAVHGVDNLFVASGSTFVTSGQANSTFTIVAFAVRLADHLHELITGATVPTPAQ